MDRLIVRLTDAKEYVYRWRLRAAGGDWLDEPDQGTLSDLADAFRGVPAEIWLLLPGTHVVCKELQFEASERKHLASIVPFQFEEHVARDVESLHFALGKPGENTVEVAYTNYKWLEHILESFSAEGLEVSVCTSEALMLPREPGEWSLRFGQNVSVRYGNGSAFSIEPGLMVPSIEALLNQEAPPERVLLMAEDNFGLVNLKAILPEQGFDAFVQETTLSEWDCFGLAAEAPINLRQGPLSRRFPFERWLTQWKKVGILGAVAVLAYIAVNLSGYHLLKAENTGLRRQIEQTYREVIPRGRITDPERQLKSKVNALQNVSNAASVVELMANVAPMLSQSEGLSIQAMNYIGSRGELRLNLQAKSFNAIEKLRVSIEEKGLEAELLNSSAQGKGHQARMRIKQVM